MANHHTDNKYMDNHLRELVGNNPDNHIIHRDSLDSHHNRHHLQMLDIVDMKQVLIFYLL